MITMTELIAELISLALACVLGGFLGFAFADDIPDSTAWPKCPNDSLYYEKCLNQETCPNVAEAHECREHWCYWHEWRRACKELCRTAAGKADGDCQFHHCGVDLLNVYADWSCLKRHPKRNVE